MGLLNMVYIADEVKWSAFMMFVTIFKFLSDIICYQFIYI